MNASHLIALLVATGAAVAAEPPRNGAKLISPGGLPVRVHVFEDYETGIEKRWWLRGTAETQNLAPSLSRSVANRRACRATATKDFDDKMGDPTKDFKAVIFNPVPGPPMGPHTRLSFRYWLSGTDTLRVQIYSLSNGYHRFLTLTNLPQRSWQSAAVDMTQARRPDGTGGPLAEDERIDDIQFYIDLTSDLIIDDIVLYEPSSPTPLAATPPPPPPARILFTGWLDTGKQGAEWPGDFEIVSHAPPLKWKAAKAVANATTNEASIRLSLRGERPLSALNRLRFRYRSGTTGTIRVTLANSHSAKQWCNTVRTGVTGGWNEATVDFLVKEPNALADELRFAVSNGAELLVDDVLLFEPNHEASAPIETSK